MVVSLELLDLGISNITLKRRSPSPVLSSLGMTESLMIGYSQLEILLYITQ